MYNFGSKTFNQYEVKKGNKSLVLEAIKNHSPISRASIAELTQLNKGTVSSLVNELIEDQIVTETGPGQSSGGRRPIMLLFNSNAGYSIGIDIGVNYLLGILTNLNGEIITEKKVDLNHHEFESVMDQVQSIVDYLKSQMNPTPYGLVGIGVGVPGTVHKNGTVLLAPNLGWRDIPLKEHMERLFQVPVTVENEANAGSYGEKIYGVGRGFDNIAYISAGIGIGVGLIINGKLYKGNNGFSGEMGHMTVELNGKLCRCGNRGCWELYASEQTIIEKAKEADIPNEKATLENLIHLAEQGNSKANDIFSEIGELLGIGITNIINTFNPEQIIIGNRLAMANNWIKPSLDQKLKQNLLSFFQEDLSIQFSTLNSYSASLGVSAFTIEKFLMISLTNGTNTAFR
ncbi:ROK family transcriptional regulator [Piscibacillus halophilus]|uniref:ROK family transcriptional regulator n=1 Tax=Piscibacillus halophilus TaxID=571933 RepID=UPI00158EA616|nr:ROK family transcriptional regulator [Piscibacillus halophilus]